MTTILRQKYFFILIPWKAVVVASIPWKFYGFYPNRFVIMMKITKKFWTLKIFLRPLNNKWERKKKILYQKKIWWNYEIIENWWKSQKKNDFPKILWHQLWTNLRRKNFFFQNFSFEIFTYKNTLSKNGIKIYGCRKYFLS